MQMKWKLKTTNFVGKAGVQTFRSQITANAIHFIHEYTIKKKDF